MDAKTMFILFFIVPVILGVVITLTGVVFLIIDARRRKEAGIVETQGWETTGGKIVASNLEKDEVQKEDAGGVHIDFSYEPVVEYVYTIGEKEYRSSKIFPGEHIYFSEKIAREILDVYSLNKYMPVSYNPNNPDDSSLESRPEGTNYIYIMGLVFTSFGVLACCFATFMTFIAIGKY